MSRASLLVICSGAILALTAVLLLPRSTPPEEKRALTARNSPVSSREDSVPGTQISRATLPPPAADHGWRIPRDPAEAIRNMRSRTTTRASFLRDVFSNRREKVESLVELALRLPQADQQIAFEALFRALRRGSRYRSAQWQDLSSRIWKTISTEGPPGLVVAPGELLAGILAEMNASPQVVARMAATVKSGNSARFAAGAVSQIAQSNPAAALALSNLMDDRSEAAAAVALGWSRRNPRQAADWANTLDNSGVRADALSAIVQNTANLDVGYAAALLSSIPDSPKRSDAIRNVAGVWAGVDTDAALAWARSLPSPADTQAAIEEIREVAPTGIGLTITQPRGSRYPTAAGLLPNSPAARIEAIHPGDQIVAVAGGAGSDWVATEGRSVQQVVELIRGESGNPVQVQVLPAGATDPSQTRMVTLVREQLKFRRPQPGLPNK